jgi:cytochrome c oxidase subunit II
MGTTVEVLDQASFDKWYASGPVKMDSTVAAIPGAAGRLLTEQKGCIACHSADGTKIVGPSYKGIFGHKVTVSSDGKDREITVDEEYIKKSILEPDADIVKGFNKGSMISYKGQLNDQEIEEIIEYIKTLSEEKK